MNNVKALAGLLTYSPIARPSRPIPIAIGIRDSGPMSGQRLMELTAAGQLRICTVFPFNSFPSTKLGGQETESAANLGEDSGMARGLVYWFQALSINADNLSVMLKSSKKTQHPFLTCSPAPVLPADACKACSTTGLQDIIYQLLNRIITMKKILPVITFLVSFGAYCQNMPDTAKKNLGDTIKKDIFTAPDTVKKLHGNPLSLIPPAIAIAYGVSSFIFHPVRRFDYYIYNRIERSAPNFNTNAESYFMITPVVMVYGLDLIGVEGQNRFADRTALLGLAGGFLGISELVTKHTTHRLRPNGADYLSFPSGHTGIAFLGAEFLAQEYAETSPVYTVIGYTFAVTTGVFRMYNRDHWFSDVVAGAGVGVLSTKAAYLVYPYLRNKLTHFYKNGRSTSVMPTYQNGTPGIAFAMQL